MSRSLVIAVLGSLLAGACSPREPLPARSDPPATPPIAAANANPEPLRAPAADSPAPVAPPAPPRHRAVRSDELAALLATVPEFARITGIGHTAFVLRGRLGAKRARALEALARALVADVVRRFVADGQADDAATPVDVCLFEDDASYQAFVQAAVGGDRSILGFYLPRERVVFANLGRSVGNLRHELVHPILGDDFPEMPDWLNEGLGALYGTARLRAGTFQFLVNYRLRDVHQALRRGDLPTLDELARSTSDDVYGPRAMVYYGFARHVLLYLDARGALDELVRELRSDAPSAARQSELLQRLVDEAALHTWLRRQRIGQPPTPPDQPFHP